MDDKRRVRISKFLSLVLRHDPEKLNLTLEPGGWVLIDDLLAGSDCAGFTFTRDELDAVVKACEKQRFAVDEAGTMVRANQGHSTEVDLQLLPATPPAELFHGTADRFLEAILRDGLMKMTRHHVHLSPDVETAKKVGSRRGKAAVLEVAASKMHAGGGVFYCSANGVWLVESVPPQYLRVL